MQINGPRHRKRPSFSSVLANKAETSTELGSRVLNFLNMTIRELQSCSPSLKRNAHKEERYHPKKSDMVDEWITQLHLIAADCKFHDQDEMLSDMVVLNSANKKVQEGLLETDDLDLSKL